jgi:hypothetical protein
MVAKKLPKFSPTSQEELQLASRVTETENPSLHLRSLLTDPTPRKTFSIVVVVVGISS